MLSWLLGKALRMQAPDSIPQAPTLLTSMPVPNSLRAISLATIRSISLVRLHSTAQHSTPQQGYQQMHRSPRPIKTTHCHGALLLQISGVEPASQGLFYCHCQVTNLRWISQPITESGLLVQLIAHAATQQCTAYLYCHQSEVGYLLPLQTNNQHGRVCSASCHVQRQATCSSSCTSMQRCSVMVAVRQSQHAAWVAHI